MGLFGKKKNNDAPNNAAAPEVAPLTGSYEEISCQVSVSHDGKKHTIESDGSIRFYDELVSIYACPPKNLAKEMLIGSFGIKNPVEALRYPYSAISRVFFARKITAKVEFTDGKYAYLIMMNGAVRDRFTALFAAHGITVLPK